MEVHNQNDNSYINNEKSPSPRDNAHVIEESIRLNSIKDENMSTWNII